MGVDESAVMRGLTPMMLAGLFYMFVVANFMGRKERQRLGVANLSEAELESIMEIRDPSVLEIRRPKNVWINSIIELGTIALFV